MNILRASFLTILLFFFLGQTGSLHGQASETDRFYHVDEHVENTPSGAEQSLASLAAYLIEPFDSEIYKTRAIFRWITDNISYDTANFLAGRRSATEPELVLRAGTAQCGGYSALFQQLAEKAGLQSRIISGHSKGYGFNPSGEQNVDTNHQWNAVYIDGSWKLIDATWGAGYISASTRSFVRSFNEHYFLTPPEAFIFDHFPENPEDQFLDEPLSKEEYLELVWVRPPFFEHELRLRSHEQRSIETHGPVTLEIELPENRVLTAMLKRDGQQQSSNQVLVHHFDGYAVVEALPQQRGSYQLEIYAAKASASPVFDWALTYDIYSRRESADPGFPESFGRFLTNRSSVISPKSYVIDAGGKTKFDVTVPGAVEVCVINNGNWITLDQDGDRFTLEMIPENGRLQVAARFENSDQFNVLLEYHVR